MNRESFLKGLKESLNHLSPAEQKEVLEDFGCHFDQGKKEGKSEEEVADQLGDPKEIGASYESGELVNYIPASDDADWHQSIQAGEIEAFYVKADIAHIDIQTAPISEIQVSIFCRDKDWIQDFSLQKMGSKAVLSIEKKKSWRISSLFSFSMGNIKAQILIPQKQFDILKIQTDTGKIEAQGLNAKSISLESDTGSVKTKEMSADHLYLQSDTGRVEGEKLATKEGHLQTDTGALSLANSLAGHWKLQSDTGSIRVLESVGAMEAQTDVGAIHYQAQEICWDLSLKTDVGAIDLGFDRADAAIGAKTDIGKIQVLHEDLKISDENKHFQSAKANYQAGTGKYRIKLSTDVGKISIRKRMEV